MAQIDTLIEDIYGLFDPSIDHEVSEENLDVLAENFKNIFRSRLKKYTPPKSPLRLSAIGKPDRQLWLSAHSDPDLDEKMPPKTYLKFLYGDLIEEMLLFLAKEAGHEVTDCQKELEVEGVLGHIDAKIDGVMVDVKSAAPFSYLKFENDLVPQDDPFGYVAQLAGYASIDTPGEDAYWLANNKVGGDICLSKLPLTVIKHHDPAERIKHLKEVLESKEMPPVCYEPVPDGKSGNMKLPVGCSYCSKKKKCYPDLRTFLYSSGPRFLTRVVREPRDTVKEV